MSGLGALTAGDIAAAEPTTLLVPLGATEQHGPHLPLHTDTVLARRWAEAVADRLPAAMVAPPLPYGSSGEHQDFAGTLSIGAEALRLVLVELVRSAAQWAERVVFLSGHAGNLAPVRAAVDQLRHEGHHVQHVFPRWETGDGPPIDAHAGRTETSLMLHLEPESVRRPLPGPGDTRPLTETLKELAAGGVAAVSPSGILGDPRPATADEGRVLLGRLVESTVDLLTAGSEPARRRATE